MAINQNHLFEDLDGIKCAIVEKNASPQRVAFLRRILEYNGFRVVVVPSPPPKVAAPPPAPKAPAAAPRPAPPATPGASSPAPATPPAAAAPKPPAAASSDAAPPTEPQASSPATPPVPAEQAPPSAPPQPAPPPPPPAPETFTIGVTDVSFNPTNAIFGRLLKAPGGHIVTLAYWQQKDNESHDEIPYFETKY